MPLRVASACSHAAGKGWVWRVPMSHMAAAVAWRPYMIQTLGSPAMPRRKHVGFFFTDQADVDDCCWHQARSSREVLSARSHA